MSGDFNVLISSAGRRIALLDIFRLTLGEMGLRGRVLAADMSRFSAAFQAADAGFLVPACTSPEFIPAVLEVCRREGVRLVVPTIDTELPLYAASRERFAREGVQVAVSSPEAIAVCGDKEQTHRWLVREGLPTVRQASVAEVLAAPGDWPFPLLVKPRNGSSSLGVAVVRDHAALEAATADGGYVVQTLAAGEEYTIDFLADRAGRCRCAVPRRRLEVRAGEVSKGMTVRSGPLEELALQVCERLPGAYGTLNVQVFLDEATGEMSVIEVNARFGGGFPLAWEAGARFPRWMVEELLGLPSTAAPARWRDRLVMLRYDAAVFADASGAGL